MMQHQGPGDGRYCCECNGCPEELATVANPEDEDWPDEVELLFHGEGPEVAGYVLDGAGLRAVPPDRACSGGRRG